MYTRNMKREKLERQELCRESLRRSKVCVCPSQTSRASGGEVVRETLEASSPDVEKE